MVFTEVAKVTSHVRVDAQTYLRRDRQISNSINTFIYYYIFYKLILNINARYETENLHRTIMCTFNQSDYSNCFFCILYISCSTPSTTHII